MSLTTVIDGDTQTNVIRLDSLIVVEAAAGGEVGQGGFDLDDLASLTDVPAMKEITITESAASPTRMFTGYIGVRDTDRGPLPKVAVQRQHDVTILDLNTVLDDQVFGTDAADRPEETDYQRITWLLTTGAMSALGITAGVVPNTNTVTLDAINYKYQTPRRVLDECAEAAGKNFFIYNYGSGNLLYYDKATGTSLSSSAKLSTVLADVDNSTTWALDEPKGRKDPTRIYSKVAFKYDGGTVVVTNSDTETTYRQREIALEDNSVRTANRATNKANKYLDASSTEEETFTCGVTLPAAKVNDIRAGQRIEVKAPHLGIASFTWFRISRRTVTPLSDVLYKVVLEFINDIKMTGFGGGQPSGPRDDPPTDDDEPDGQCIDCHRIIAPLDAAMGDTIGLAFGRTLNTVTFDGSTMQKHKCDLGLLFTTSITASIDNFGHEPGSHTPVLVAPYAVDNNGELLWDRSAEIDPLASAPMDRPRFWTVGEGEATAPDMPFAGYGTFDVDHGPAAQFIIWRCYVTNSPNDLAFKAAWTAGEVYKGLGSEVNNWVSYGAYLYSDAAWTDSNDPPTDADLPANAGQHPTGTFLGSGGSGQGIGKATEVGQPTTGWEAISSGNRIFNSTLMPGGRWVVIYATSHKSTGTIADAGVRTTLTITDNGTNDALGLDCAASPTTGPVLQSRRSRTGALVSSIDLDELPDDIRATPNAQKLFLRLGSNFTRYSRDLDVDDTLSISGFATNLNDWNVDDDYNVYRLSSNTLIKHNRDGEQLWSTNLNTAEGYLFPTTSAGNGQQVFIDEHVRVVGYHTNNHGMLLTVGRPYGNVRSVQKFKSDGDAKLLAGGRNGQCIVLAGKHNGTEIDDEEMTATHWLLRIWAAKAE